MDISGIIYELDKICYKIKHYKEIVHNKPCPLLRTNSEKQIINEVEKLLNQTKYILQQELELSKNNNREREFTLEELAYYDGSDGKPAYVAVDGIVYDVSREATWGGGTHFGLYAGKELSLQFAGCHENPQILLALPKVGVLINTLQQNGGI